MKLPASIFFILLSLILGFVLLAKSTPSPKAAIGCVANNLSGEVSSEEVAWFGGKEIVAPRLAARQSDNTVLGIATLDEKWIQVDLSEQRLRAWDGDEIFMESHISSGLPATPTPTGEFRVWVKLRASKMEGGSGRNYYYLPNVPYVMYFENDEIPGWRGFGIHGTYWHNDFGTPRSRGCVNLPTPMAEKLYYWATPALPGEKQSVFSGPDNPGIRVIIHN